MKKISQAELRKHEQLQQDYRETRKKYEDSAHRLIDRMDFGEEFEPGALDARIEVRLSRRFSFPALAQLLGEEQAEDLRKLIPPTSSRYLRLNR